MPSTEFNFKKILFLIKYFEEQLQREHKNKFYRSFIFNEYLKFLMNINNEKVEQIFLI